MLISLLILIGMFFTISLYIYENSKLSKLTGYSYIHYLLNNEMQSYYKLVSTL